MIPPGPLVKRIAQIHRAVGRNPNVVRAVEIFALIAFDEHRHFFVGRDRPKLVLLVGAGNEVAFRVEAHSIRAAGGLHERGQLSVHAPFQDAIIRLVGEKNVAVRVARRAFGEFEVAGEFFKFRAGCDDAFGHGRRKTCEAETNPSSEKNQWFLGNHPEQSASVKNFRRQKNA